MPALTSLHIPRFSLLLSMLGDSKFGIFWQDPLKIVWLGTYHIACDCVGIYNAGP